MYYIVRFSTRIDSQKNIPRKAKGSSVLNKLQHIDNRSLLMSWLKNLSSMQLHEGQGATSQNDLVLLK